MKQPVNHTSAISVASNKLAFDETGPLLARPRQPRLVESSIQCYNPRVSECSIGQGQTLLVWAAGAAPGGKRVMGKPRSTKGKILLVGASWEGSDTFTAMLAGQGHEVHAAATGADALKLVRDHAPDVVLLSDSLPDTDARELCRRLQTGEPGRNLPVLFLSSTMSPDAIREIFAAGASDVLVQPLDERLLLSRIETLLELAELRKEIVRRDDLLEREVATRKQVESNLRTAELSGSDLLDNLSEVIYTTSVDGLLTYVSPGIERLLGYTPDEAIGRHVRDFVHPESRSLLADRMQRVLAGHRETNEYLLLTRSGEARWAHTSSQPLYTDRQVIGLQGVLTDITERRQAETQIRQQNQFLTTVLESLTHPFYVVNLHDYTIQMANSAARVENLAGEATCYALTHHRDAPCSSEEHPCPIEELKRTGKPVTVEHVHYTPEGTERFVEVHSYPLFDIEGTIVRAIEYTLDITERKQAEAALRESEARWRSLTERSPDHVILLDTDLNVQFLNYPSPGLSVDELIGTPLHAYVQEERQQEIKEILEHVLTSAEPATYETSYRTPDGDTIYYESRVVPRSVEGQIVGLAVNARDITEHKQTEQALRDAMETAEQARQAEQEGRLEADQRRRVAESFAGVMAALNSNQPFEHVLNHIAAQAKELLGNDHVAIYSLADSGRRLVLQTSEGSLQADHEAMDKLCNLPAIAQALELREPVTVSNLEIASPEGDRQHTAPCRALLAVPVIVSDELYGSVVMCSAESRVFSAEEIELAGVFGNQVALAMESARLRSEREQAAAAAERNRLARDLHDSVTQALFSASLVAEVLPQVWKRNPDLAREGLQELGSLNRGALAEMRTMLLELRPTAVLETRLSDLVRQLTEAMTARADLRVTYNIEPSPTLPSDVHVAFYRIAQEALNNVMKHAGASQVKVSLVAKPSAEPYASGGWQGQVTLTVGDDGQGFREGGPTPDRMGLGIMRERAEAIGAELAIDSRPGQGSRLTLAWPGRNQPQ